MDMEKYSYDGKFNGNVIVLGQTGCGKTPFVQNLGKKQYIWKHYKCFVGNKHVVKRKRTSNKVLF